MAKRTLVPDVVLSFLHPAPSVLVGSQELWLPAGAISGITYIYVATSNVSGIESSTLRGPLT
eukprot:scaffold477178_cov13-Prasinocladus_malaysianus.AAC.1